MSKPRGIAEQIIKLHKEGKSYRQISQILNCSKSTVCYHVGEGQKRKAYTKQINLRKKRHPYQKKLDNFIYTTKRYNEITSKQISTFYKILYTRVLSFHKTTNNKGRALMKDVTFTVEDIINKFGENPICYLTGESIDISDTKSYSFDHIIPVSKGGNNSLNNLGITTKIANQAKTNMSVDELIQFCKKVLIFRGYEIK